MYIIDFFRWNLHFKKIRKNRLKIDSGQISLEAPAFGASKPSGNFLQLTALIWSMPSLGNYPEAKPKPIDFI